MAEALKQQFGAAIPERIAAMIQAVHPSFGARMFLEDVLDGYEVLELLPRARKIARALRRHLPEDFPRACEILLASLGPKSPMARRHGHGAYPLSVANTLNDVGRDHPELLAKTARRWLRGASKERRANIIRAHTRSRSC